MSGDTDEEPRPDRRRARRRRAGARGPSQSSDRDDRRGRGRRRPRPHREDHARHPELPHDARRGRGGRQRGRRPAARALPSESAAPELDRRAGVRARRRRRCVRRAGCSATTVSSSSSPPTRTASRPARSIDVGRGRGWAIPAIPERIAGIEGSATRTLGTGAIRRHQEREEVRGRMGAAAAADDDAPRFPTRGAWEEAKAIIGARRDRLALGLLLMVFNRLAGFVLPATSKVLVDDVIGKGRGDLLAPLALAVGAATVVQAATTFGNAQILGVAAQHAITDMRRRVQAHVVRLPVRLLRLDAGRRPDLAHHDRRRGHPQPGRHRPRAARRRHRHRGGRARVLLVYLNWRLTRRDSLVLGAFGGGDGARLRTACGRCSASAARSTPRSPAGWTRRSAASASSRRTPPSGARTLVFARGVAPAVPQHRRVDDRRLGDDGVLDDRRRRRRR